MNKDYNYYFIKKSSGKNTEDIIMSIKRLLKIKLNKFNTILVLDKSTVN